MEDKTIFAVSSVDNNLFRDNYRNSFANHFPHLQETSSNYKMCLASIDLEKLFRTIGRNETFFILLNFKYNTLDPNYWRGGSYYFKDINRYNDKTIHKYMAFEIPTKIDPSNESLAMRGILFILRPGRYHDMHDLSNTLNHDFNILGINNLIKFEYSNAEYNFVFLLHINEQIERCVFSSNLFQLMDIRKRKKINVIF